MSYGIFLGRCQPFHLGHEHAIHEIIRDGLEPVVLLGTSRDRDERNPYRATQRGAMVLTVFPNIAVRAVLDVPGDDDAWWEGLLSKITWAQPRVFYTYTKWQDRDMGSFFESKGEQVKRYVPLLEVNATDIRRDLEGNKRFLDGRVYRYLCGLQSSGPSLTNEKSLGSRAG